MKKFASVDELLDFAILQEEEAEKLYLELAGKTGSKAMKAQFEEFAAEERMHKAKLENIKEGKLFAPISANVLDLKIAEYARDLSKEEVIDYPTALVYAMKREKAAYRMYTELASLTEDEQLKQLLTSLANEEANHKLRFEMEYDEFVNDEN